MIPKYKSLGLASRRLISTIQHCSPSLPKSTVSILDQTFKLDKELIKGVFVFWFRKLPTFAVDIGLHPGCSSMADSDDGRGPGGLDLEAGTSKNAQDLALAAELFRISGQFCPLPPLDRHGGLDRTWDELQLGGLHQPQERRGRAQHQVQLRDRRRPCQQVISIINSVVTLSSNMIYFRRVVVMAFKEKLAAFDAGNLEPRFTVSSCYPSPGVHANPLALGDRWLAYADQRYVNIHRSLGGMEADSGQSVAAWGINVGSKLAQGVSKIYSNIFSSSATSTSGTKTPPPCHTSSSPSHGTSSTASGTEGQKGIVTVLDILKVYDPDRDEVSLSEKISGVVAHFVAHTKVRFHILSEY